MKLSIELYYIESNGPNYKASTVPVNLIVAVNGKYKSSIYKNETVTFTLVLPGIFNIVLVSNNFVSRLLNYLFASYPLSKF